MDEILHKRLKLQLEENALINTQVSAAVSFFRFIISYLQDLLREVKHASSEYDGVLRKQTKGKDLPNVDISVIFGSLCMYMLVLNCDPTLSL